MGWKVECPRCGAQVYTASEDRVPLHDVRGRSVPCTHFQGAEGLGQDEDAEQDEDESDGLELQGRLQR